MACAKVHWPGENAQSGSAVDETGCVRWAAQIEIAQRTELSARWIGPCQVHAKRLASAGEGLVTTMCAALQRLQMVEAGAAYETPRRSFVRVVEIEQSDSGAAKRNHHYIAQHAGVSLSRSGAWRRRAEPFDAAPFNPVSGGRRSG